MDALLDLAKSRSVKVEHDPRTTVADVAILRHACVRVHEDVRQGVVVDVIRVMDREVEPSADEIPPRRPRGSARRCDSRPCKERKAVSLDAPAQDADGHEQMIVASDGADVPDTRGLAVETSRCGASRRNGKSSA